MALYDDLEPLNAAELELIEKTAKGQDADYRTHDKETNDPARGTEWGEERTIRGEIICALLTGARDDWPITHRGLVDLGARVTGEIDLDCADVKVPFGLVGCHVEKPIDLRHARMNVLNLDGTHVPGLNADGL